MSLYNSRQHCMVVHAHYPEMETRVERQALALIQHGYEVDVICLRKDGEAAFDTQDGVNIYRLPVSRHRKSGQIVQLLEYLIFFVLSFFKLALLHRRRRYRTIQVHNLPDFLVFAALVPKLTGAKIILDLHDLMPEFYAERFQQSMESLPVRLVLWQEQLACRFADHIITVTELWRQSLIERGQSSEKVSVVMNLADDHIFFSDPATRLPLLGDDRLHMIYHGSLTERYGIDLVIQAVDKVRNKIEVRLTIHGGGAYLEDLMKLTEELDLGEYVHFSTSFLSTSELSNLLRQADVGIVPNRRDIFTDGILPTKLMEYVASGVPVIASRTPAIATYFDETMIQFFTPDDADDLADCIQRLYVDRERLAQLAENAEKFNQKYNWSKASTEYVGLVNQLGKQPEALHYESS